MAGDYTLRRILGAAVTLLLVSATAGCSGEEREYAVPKTFCGVPVKSELLTPFLPGGDNLRAVSQDPEKRIVTDCLLRVDGEWQFRVEGTWRMAGYTLDAFTSERLFPAPSLTKKSTYVVSDRSAATVFPCKAPNIQVRDEEGKSAPTGAFSLHAEVNKDHRPQDDDATKKAMERFIVSYTKALKKKLSCEGEPS